jgi:hypothetical protein
MPIPQFHRTPKTRRRRTRHASFPQETADVQDLEPKLTATDTLAPIAPRDAHDTPVEPTDSADAPPSEEVPALLSSWPPRHSHS